MNKQADSFVHIKMNTSTLKKLLASHALYLEDMRMLDAHSQQMVKRLLSDSVSGLS